MAATDCSSKLYADGYFRSRGLKDISSGTGKVVVLRGWLELGYEDGDRNSRATGRLPKHPRTLRSLLIRGALIL